MLVSSWSEVGAWWSTRPEAARDPREDHPGRHLRSGREIDVGGHATAPLAMRASVERYRVLHECVVIMSIDTLPLPRVPPTERRPGQGIEEGFGLGAPAAAHRGGVDDGCTRRATEPRCPTAPYDWPCAIHHRPGRAKPGSTVSSQSGLSGRVGAFGGPGAVTVPTIGLDHVGPDPGGDGAGRRSFLLDDRPTNGESPVTEVSPSHERERGTRPCSPSVGPDQIGLV
jgi:hypothetical protein